ncbi:hypothetical protein PNOK_0001600 [Pyrrhoderma noxium]|uniref:DUF6533 domain-containing protein n=1 Tax=Pyrrhoderma noxium TaxID=2282107 RepID=A0A286UTP8_9AGAM|nr:hypothetical protein PNOK_0001600 [Pyrrhoderma noxium]
MSHMGPLLLSSVVLTVTINKYMQLAISSLLVYDVFTLDKEVQYLWKIPWHNAKNFIILINRYVGIVGAFSFLQFVSEHTRGDFLWIKDSANYINQSIIDYILMTRVIVIWRNEQHLDLLLKFFISAKLLTKLAIFIWLDLIQHPGINPETGLNCAVPVTNIQRLNTLGVVDWGITYHVEATPLFLCDSFTQWNCKYKTLGNPAFLSIISSRLFFELKDTGEQKHIPASLANISIPNSDHRMEDISGYMNPGLMKRQITLTSKKIDDCLESTLICSTTLVYDALINIEKEVSYIWATTNRNYQHVLILIIRYIGIIGSVSALLYQSKSATQNLCKPVVYFVLVRDISIYITTTATNWILANHVSALWNHGIILSITLKLLVILAAMVKLVILAIFESVNKPVTQSLSQDFVVCVSDLNLVVLGKISCIISLITGTLLFALAFLGIIAFWNPSELGRRGKGIIKALIKCHFIYYMLILFNSVINIASYMLIGGSAAPELQATLSVLGNPSFLSVFGVHLFYDLQESSTKNLTENLDLDELDSQDHAPEQSQY